MKYLIWLCYYPVNLLANLLAILLSPILALPCFVTVINGREWLIPQLSWFQTFDNPLDSFSKDGYGTAYSPYTNRIKWLCRNPAYGFAQDILGDNPPAWQFKQIVPIGFGYGLDVNIGWKSHPPLTRLMYAGRIFKLVKLNG